MPERKPFELVRMVKDGEIEIPEFQREFVWSNKQVEDLADSIYNGYPIGLITLYRLPRELREGRNAQYWVLDGQQRILSLYLIFNGSIEEAGRTKKLWVWFNPRTEEFQSTEPPRRLGEEWVNLSEVLNMTDEQLVRFMQNRPSGERDKIHVLWLRFRDYNVLVHELHEDLDLDRLGDIFVRINFAGTRVKGAEVYSTMLAVTQPGIVDELRKFVKTLDWDIDYGVAMRTFMAFLTDGKVRLESRVLDQAAKLKEVLQSKRDSIPDILNKTKSSIKSAIELLRDPSKLAIVSPSQDFIPSQNVLVTMAYYIGKKRELSDKEKRGLLGWFVLASSFARYSSATETRLNEDLSEIQKGGDYNELIKILEKREGSLKERIIDKISKGELDKLLLYAILKANSVKDLLSHQDITTADATIHHIFPKAILADSEFEQSADHVGNLTITTMGTNTTLRSREPEIYLRKVPPEIRRTHLIPDNPELWKVRNFKEFLEERKKLLIKAVDKFWQTFIP